MYWETKLVWRAGVGDQLERRMQVRADTASDAIEDAIRLTRERFNIEGQPVEVAVDRIGIVNFSGEHL